MLAAFRRADNVTNKIQDAEVRGQVNEVLVTLHWVFEQYVTLTLDQEREIGKLESKLKAIQNKQTKP